VLYIFIDFIEIYSGTTQTFFGHYKTILLHSVILTVVCFTYQEIIFKTHYLPVTKPCVKTSRSDVITCLPKLCWTGRCLALTSPADKNQSTSPADKNQSTWVQLTKISWQKSGKRSDHNQSSKQITSPMLSIFMKGQFLPVTVKLRQKLQF